MDAIGASSSRKCDNWPMRAFPSQLLLAAVAVALTSATASAADPQPIRISVPACSSTPFSVEAFLGALQVELAGHVPPCCLLDQASPPDADPHAGVRVTLSIDPCDESTASVEIRVRDPARAASLARQVGLGDIPVEARPRALALAVAELVHSATVPPAVGPAGPPAATAAPPTASVGAGDSGGAPRARLPWLSVSAIIEIETHPGHNMTLWGIRPSVTVARGRWQAALDVDVMAGDPSVALGDVDTRLLAGTLAAGPRFSLGRLIVEAAACGRFGWAWMAGQTSDANAVASSASAPFASAAGRLGIFLPTAAQVSHLRALVEAGTTIHGLDATVNGTPAAGLTGGYVLFGLGFGESR
jgi:hypothetical protein